MVLKNSRVKINYYAIILYTKYLLYLVYYSISFKPIIIELSYYVVHKVNNT